MKSYRLFFLFVLFLLLFNEPVLSIVNRAELVAGIPLLYLYVLVLWLVLIGAIAYALYQSEATEEATVDE
ncbi:hypothetical protein [Tellurirhabdus rosea]|uniref:hypothetical protein n=1 Tax=Tellurirhabdus rosea TaxID=2674997 RepID=UPI00224FB640|nr:hypothetical protein [Tellurirhabdus rosea]